MKQWEVWILDGHGFHQPMKCSAPNKREARMCGNRYIRLWNLVGAKITEIKEVQEVETCSTQ